MTTNTYREITNRKNRHALYSATVFLGLFALILRKIADPDIWYHLSIGREIFTTKTIPAFEFLVYPNSGDIAELHEWGYGLMMFLIHKVSGIEGLSVANALIGTFALYTLYKISVHHTRSLTPSIFTLAFILLMVDLRLAYRPEMILFVVLALQIYCLERYSENHHANWLIPLPLSGLLLAQFHPSALILLLVWGIYGLGFIWDAKDDRPKLTKTIFTGISFAAGTAALSLINPYGIDQLLKPINFSSLDSGVLQFIGEFKPILKTDIAYLFICLVIVSFSCLFFLRRLRITYTLLLLSFGFLTYRYNRNLALLGIVMFVPIATGLSEIERRLQSLRFGFKYVLPLITYSFIALIIFLVSGNEESGIGVLKGRFPAKIAEELNNKNPVGQIFNHYDLGGYLGWKLGGKYKVFVDGRQYGENRAWEAYNTISQGRPGWNYLLNRYQVKWIITPITYTGTGVIIPLTGVLLNSDYWVPIMRDNQVILYTSLELTKINGFTLLNPAEIWKSATNEAENALKAQPNNIDILFTYAYTNEKLSQFEVARKGYQKILDIQPERQDIQMRINSIDKDTRKNN